MDYVISLNCLYGQCDITKQSFSQGAGLLLDEWTIEIVLFYLSLKMKYYRKLKSKSKKLYYISINKLKENY